MNPYRKEFYERQVAWHGYDSLEKTERHHEERLKYYRWFVSGWLPEAKSVRILDVACGAGQFLYFLRREGFYQAEGVDVDVQQVALANALGLHCHCAEALRFVKASEQSWDMVSLLDVLEHLTTEEMHDLLGQLAKKLSAGGRLLLSVPNAESPLGLYTRYSDITHETAFSVTSLTEALFCHGLTVEAVRDPWPAPVDICRQLYRGMAKAARKLEGIRLRILGLSAPSVWSPVFWMLARKHT